MQSLFNKLEVINFEDDLLRNIKSIRVSQHLFDDLSDNPSDWEHANSAEMHSKPKHYLPSPIIHRPFDEALFIQAIHFPFDSHNWASSRYSRGEYGIWYGAIELDTTIYETVYHWKRFIAAAQFKSLDDIIIGERRVFKVRCEALLLDLKKKVKEFPALINPSDYSWTQSIGEYLHKQGHPGLLSLSARCKGIISAIFTPNVLSNPRDLCYLTYTLDTQTKKTTVERVPGEVHLVL